MEPPFPKYLTIGKKTKDISIILSLALVLITVFCLYNPYLLKYPSLAIYKNSDDDVETTEQCDISRGEWIPHPDAPHYTNTTCWAIHEHQNCMKYGRPDSDFIKWRWKPDGCALPEFNPSQFLDMVRDKSLAFVGDSVGRNQMQSMICLLSRVEYPIDVSTSSDQYFKRWRYVNYNFTLAAFWTPFLVRSQERGSHGPTHTGLFNLYLDEFDHSWTTQIDDFDYVILNSGHWLTRTAVYYENRSVVGCHYCQLPNITELKMSYAYRRVFRTALKAINGREHFKGVTFLRTFSPSHFEGGLWNEGGNCVRTRPFRSNETVLEGVGLEFYTIQLEEFSFAERERKKRLRLLDTTHAMLLRPDGHPSRYGHWPDENVTLYNDCVHWCLPGPIDSWAEFLFHLLKLEARISRGKKIFI
ncbi:protein trichome birefringence-like 19 [Primulina eburnea]|uniref:protein trichome birefringence-like 19 n=1 Tax=Primulina eburnea TaxID=1245227 RepID=UPI003C6C8E19